ncbi:NYN domain-containing protein [Flavobacterium fontis]|uniref:NYN domain-containing protein n=1 Tax=Flavobacterium fontis TaxID=1124188 RepID=UPI00116040FA|nr:hypothetical protein [Flavobacterium fontis]
MAIIPFIYDRKQIIDNSEIIIGNDMRHKYLNVVITRNDSVLKFKSLNNNLIRFKSNNGIYHLKIFIKNTEAISKKFQILENKPKYIYVFLESENSNYYKYYDSIVSTKIAKQTEKRILSRDELREKLKEIKKGISIADLEKLGYNVEKEKIKLYLRDKPFPRD